MCSASPTARGEHVTSRRLRRNSKISSCSNEVTFSRRKVCSSALISGGVDIRSQLEEGSQEIVDRTLVDQVVGRRGRALDADADGEPARARHVGEHVLVGI